MVDIKTSDYPPREELWAAIKEAHYYLHQWVNDPSSRLHPTEGRIEFDAYSWGERGDGGCTACLAGLWYLHKVGRLLTVKVNDSDEYEDLLPTYWPVCRFLDNLRHTWAFTADIQRELGVVLPKYDSELEEAIGKWTLHRPEDILIFLAWLLQQRDIQHSNGEAG
jgi:hypothetical protein